MVGLDVTNRVQLTRDDCAALVGRTSPEAALVHEVTRRLFEELGQNGMALHDPLAVSVAVDPSLVTTVEAHVVVETRGEHTMGQTVADLRARARPHASAEATQVCLDVDVARARALFFEALGLR
jgi:purine nucleosidase